MKESVYSKMNFDRNVYYEYVPKDELNKAKERKKIRSQGITILNLSGQRKMNFSR